MDLHHIPQNYIITTYTNRKLNLLDPDPDEICLRDIGISLDHTFPNVWGRMGKPIPLSLRCIFMAKAYSLACTMYPKDFGEFNIDTSLALVLGSAPYGYLGYSRLSLQHQFYKDTQTRLIEALEKKYGVELQESVKSFYSFYQGNTFQTLVNYYLSIYVSKGKVDDRIPRDVGGYILTDIKNLGYRETAGDYFMYFMFDGFLDKHKPLLQQYIKDTYIDITGLTPPRFKMLAYIFAEHNYTLEQLLKTLFDLVVTEPVSFNEILDMLRQFRQTEYATYIINPIETIVKSMKIMSH